MRWVVTDRRLRAAHLDRLRVAPEEVNIGFHVLPTAAQ